MTFIKENLLEYLLECIMQHSVFQNVNTHMSLISENNVSVKKAKILI